VTAVRVGAIQTISVRTCSGTDQASRQFHALRVPE
jgi:hypothetical protein